MPFKKIKPLEFPEEAHEIAELLCVRCRRRWIAVFPKTLLLKDIQCPECLTPGGVIKTGQGLEEVIVEEARKNMES